MVNNSFFFFPSEEKELSLMTEEQDTGEKGMVSEHTTSYHSVHS